MRHSEIMRAFSGTKVDESWAFAGKTRRETTYLTHGYHRYPAKFIPQLVSRLVEKYTDIGDLVVDPFGGCGTTIVESKVMGRRAIGVDINPVAALIAKVKCTPIEPRTLRTVFNALRKNLAEFDEADECRSPAHEKIDYWFPPQQKAALAHMLSCIRKIKDENARDFFLCAFSNILKSCSIWNQKSNKPIRDFNKIPADPFAAFYRQCKFMMLANDEFHSRLSRTNRLDTDCEVHCANAKKLPVGDKKANLIVTSPPYVTSYEYADLHQLTVFWLEFANDLAEFRRRFIGTANTRRNGDNLESEIADDICRKLAAASRKTASEVAAYYADLLDVFKEANRILTIGGKACVVIGNTALKGVEILNAEVFAEQLSRLGFRLAELIKREIPSKNIPSVRDKHTGRFAKVDSANKIFAYPTEYILVMEKT